MPTKDYIFRFKQFVKRTDKRIKNLKKKIKWIIHCCSIVNQMMKANSITIDTRYWNPQTINKEGSYPTISFTKRDVIND